MKKLFSVLVSLLLVVGLTTEADAQNRSVAYNAVTYTDSEKDTSAVFGLSLPGQQTPRYVAFLADFDDSVSVNIYVQYRRTGGTWSADVELTTDSLTATAAKAIGYVLRGDGNVADKIPGADQVRFHADYRSVGNAASGKLTAVLWRKQ